MSWRGRNLATRQDRLVLEVKAIASQRLDLYLGRALNWRSRSRLQEIIREGRVKVNGVEAKPSRRVRNGDAVVLELSMGTGLPEDYAALDLDILYEDPWLVCVNKPAGLLVHPVGRHVYDTLINHLHHRYRTAESQDETTAGKPSSTGAGVVPRLCHRIDRGTTGAILVAKDPIVHRDVQYQFAKRLVHKEYVALVVGTFPDEPQTLATPIGEGRCLQSCLEHRVLKESRTGVRVLKRFREFTLLSCSPKTGRQNQIRVHLAARGHPLVGDNRYGGGDPPGGFPDRFLLHSRHLVFYHPRLKSGVEIEAPLPSDFHELLESLR